jgi:hypothetical protein
MPDHTTAERTTARRDVAHAGAGAMAAPRPMMPTDGSVVHSGTHSSIYCAPCARWIDCHAGIPPEAALERHAALLH